MEIISLSPPIAETSRYIWHCVNNKSCRELGVSRYVRNKETGEQFLIHDTETWFPFIKGICRMGFCI